MPKLKLLILFLTTALFSLMNFGTLFAQADDVTVVEPVEGYEFSLPAGWDFDYTDDDAAYFYDGDYNINFDFYLPEDLEAQDIPADDLIGATEAVFYAADESITFADVEAEVVEVDGLELAVVDFTDNADGEDYPVAFITLYLADGTLIYGKVYPVEGSDPIPDDILEATVLILSSLQAVEA